MSKQNNLISTAREWVSLKLIWPDMGNGDFPSKTGDLQTIANYSKTVKYKCIGSLKPVQVQGLDQS